jgi:pimeloyl-ACP methyl ester carboxylesterase
MNSRQKIAVLFAAIVIFTALIVVIIPLFKKQSRHAFQYDHIQLAGPGYLVDCTLLPAKKLSPSKESVLVVYLHGLSANCEQAFEVPSKCPFAFGTREAFPNVTFFSCDYGTVGSWCNNYGYKDITCSIEEISKRIPISKIIMAGTSMGGCTALTYATSAPKNIKDKIIGVLAIYAAGDLTRLYELGLCTKRDNWWWRIYDNRDAWLI